MNTITNTFLFLCSSSYRELLGTAETIIEMDSQIKSVENLMGEMGKQCNSRLLNDKMSNSVRWDASIRATGIHHQYYESCEPEESL